MSRGRQGDIGFGKLVKDRIGREGYSFNGWCGERENLVQPKIGVSPLFVYSIS